jgi:hypothetical protein
LEIIKYKILIKSNYHRYSFIAITSKKGSLHFMGLEKKFGLKFLKCIRVSKYLSIKLPLLSPGKGPTPTEAPHHPLNTEVEL